MTIRLAQPEDFPAIVEMVREFSAATDYCEYGIDDDSCFAMLQASTDQGLCFVGVDEELTGFISGLIFGAPMNNSVRIAAELAWWVKPAYRGTPTGVKLLKEFEKSAKKAGAKMVSMMCLEAMKADKVEALYERMGYSATERAFVRKL